MVTTTLLVTVSSASAHEIVPGLRGFPSLLLHPFVAVEMVLIMVGLALAAGASGPQMPLAAGMVAVMLGSLAGAVAQPSALTVPGLWRGPLVLALGLGALVATGRSLGRSVLVALGFVAAIAIGLGVPPERVGWVGKVEVAGAAAAAIAVTLLALALPRAKFADHAPVRIATRIAGAWCVAIASLGLATGLR
jgi:hydrogenase/urease accessory protein HupE